jgi:hypothetical protein
LTRLAVEIASVETLTDLAGVASRVADVGAAAQLLVKVVIGGVVWPPQVSRMLIVEAAVAPRQA